jgi:alginate O-acetyltransferase complex protein AlgI
MQFVSPLYLCFLPLTWLLFWLTPVSRRWMILLAASMLFASWHNPGTLLVLCLFSGFTFASGFLLNKARSGRSIIFYSSLIIQISNLLLLKYAESGGAGLHFVFKEAGFRSDVILMAVGFSFYTLQHIGYLCDIYFGRITPVSQPFRFLLFSSMPARLKKYKACCRSSQLPRLQKVCLCWVYNASCSAFSKKCYWPTGLPPW